MPQKKKKKPQKQSWTITRLSTEAKLEMKSRRQQESKHETCYNVEKIRDRLSVSCFSGEDIREKSRTST